jgi:hypothetical protein
MSYLPGSPVGGPNASQPNIGVAAAVGLAAAIGSGLVVGILSGLINSQFAYGAVLIGFAVGGTMRRFGRSQAMGLTSAVIAVAGSALSSVVAEITRLVNHFHIALSIVLSHLSIVFRALPHYIGFLGFLFWALGAYIGWATISGRNRASRRRYGRAGQGSPYGTPSPYGAPAAPGQPMGGPGSPGQPYFPGQQPGTYGQPGFGTPGQQGFDTGQGFGAPGTPGYAGPGFAMPGQQPPQPPPGQPPTGS